jgi:hypothetical protein
LRPKLIYEFYHQRDIKIVDGKLFYEKRWFRRGQAVQVEAKNGDKFPAMISAIGGLSKNNLHSETFPN